MTRSPATTAARTRGVPAKPCGLALVCEGTPNQNPRSQPASYDHTWIRDGVAPKASLRA